MERFFNPNGGIVVISEITTPEEWARIKEDLVTTIICDPNSSEYHVWSAFQCLCAITDRERTHSTFPKIIDSLEKYHPNIAQSIVPILPNRFTRNHLVFIEV